MFLAEECTGTGLRSYLRSARAVADQTSTADGVDWTRIHSFNSLIHSKVSGTFPLPVTVRQWAGQNWQRK